MPSHRFFRRLQHRCVFLCIVEAVSLSCGLRVEIAQATPLSAAEFATLAARCAPSISEQTLAAVARTESGFNPWALHDDTTGQIESLGSLQSAMAVASGWIARGDSVDLGLMQINSANLPTLDMTVAEAFDPCASLAGGTAVLQAAFGKDKPRSNAQVALLLALSRYNTGSPLRGIMNGYARKVVVNADEPVQPSPSSAVEARSMFALIGAGAASDTDAPPEWDVSASGAYAQMHGAPWLVTFTPTRADASLLPTTARRGIAGKPKRSSAGGTMRLLLPAAAMLAAAPISPERHRSNPIQPTEESSQPCRKSSPCRSNAYGL